MSRIVYLDGSFVHEAEAKLSIYDLSVMQSAAAFEMTRSFHGVHFKLREHLERLERSCQALSIPVPTLPMLEGECEDCWDEMEWTTQMGLLCMQVASRNDHGPGEEHRLLIVVSPGCADIYKEIEGTITHPFVYIADFPLRFTVKGFSRYFTEGVHCITSQIQQVPDACVPSAAKHRSRLHFHLAQQQAPVGTWPILLDEKGYYCEAPGANLVSVWNNRIFTYKRQALPGISLQIVRELTGATDAQRDPQHADELWLTGTPFCALPVVSLDGQPIGDGKIGPKYKELMAKWNALVGLDIQQQIVEWDNK